MKRSKLNDLLLLKDIFTRTGTSWWVFASPVGFTLLTALFEGLSLGLLIPLTRGILKSDFTFLKDNPFFQFVFNEAGRLTARPGAAAFVLLMAVVFLVVLLKNICQYLSAYFLNKTTFDFSDKLRRHLFGRMLDFDKAFFDAMSLGYLKEVLTGHVWEIADNMRRIIRPLTSAFSLAAYLIVMIAISWQLTLVSLLVFPILHLILERMITKIRENSRTAARARNALSHYIADALANIALIKAYTCEDQEKKRFNKLSARLSNSILSMAKKDDLIPEIQELVTVLAFLLLISAVALMASLSPQEQIASFLVFFVVLRRAMTSIASVNRFGAVLARLHGSLAELKSLLDKHTGHEIRNGTRVFSGMKEKIECRNLSFAYRRGTPVLRNVSLVMPKGKVAAVVGDTGSGKTSLAHLLMRFYDVPAGMILIDGVDIREFDLKSLRQRIAFVSQANAIFNDTLRTNLTYGMELPVDEERLAEAVRKARLEGVVKALPQGYETIVGDMGVQLSGGEKQRVAIARAILKDADILILDEATSALDGKTEKLVQDAIEEAASRKTVLIIAHRLSTIRNADQIIVMSDGVVCEQGTIQQLLEKKGKFYEHWQEHNKTHAP